MKRENWPETQEMHLMVSAVEKLSLSAITVDLRYRWCLVELRIFIKMRAACFASSFVQNKRSSGERMASSRQLSFNEKFSHRTL